MIRQVPYSHANSYINRIGIFIVFTMFLNAFLGFPTTSISIITAVGIGDYFWWHSYDKLRM
jgi:small-conductance mechanosensitive channel